MVDIVIFSPTENALLSLEIAVESLWHLECQCFLEKQFRNFPVVSEWLDDFMAMYN